MRKVLKIQVCTSIQICHLSRRTKRKALDDQDGNEVQTGIGELQGKVNALEMEVSSKKVVVKSMLGETVNNAKILGSVAR